MALGSKNGSPWRVPDETPITERLRMLEEITDQGVSDPVIRGLAATAVIHAGPPRDPRLIAANILALVHAVGYVPDPPGEWFQSARWTLQHKGDCEDLSTLEEALMRIAGIRARLVWIDQTGPFNHVSTQVTFDPWSVPNEAATWLWADASVQGAQLGEHPYVAAERLGNTFVHGRLPVRGGGIHGVAATG